MAGYKKTGRDIHCSTQEMIDAVHDQIRHYDKLVDMTQATPSNNPYSDPIIHQRTDGTMVEIPKDVQNHAIMLWNQKKDQSQSQELAPASYSPYNPMPDAGPQSLDQPEEQILGHLQSSHLSQPPPVQQSPPPMHPMQFSSQQPSPREQYPQYPKYPQPPARAPYPPYPQFAERSLESEFEEEDPKIVIVKDSSSNFYLMIIAILIAGIAWFVYDKRK